jgi:hypothetical protein
VRLFSLRRKDREDCKERKRRVVEEYGDLSEEAERTIEQLSAHYLWTGLHIYF